MMALSDAVLKVRPGWQQFRLSALIYEGFKRLILF